MIDSQSVLAIVPARSGSKGIPAKNTRLLGGQPLIQYAIEVGRAADLIDRLVVSTDSPEIALLAEKLGAEVPFLRPDDLAADETPMIDVLIHSVTALESEGQRYDIIVLLQPTAPLRQPEDVTTAIRMLVEMEADSVVSVVEVPRHYVPHYVMKITKGRLAHFLPEGERITRRQDAPRAYSRNGVVYVVRRDVLVEDGSLYGHDSRPLIMDASRSVNIDSEEDWAEAERVLSGRDG